MHPVHPVNIPLPLPTDLASDLPSKSSKPAVTRRRSSTFTAITNWALSVQPGSPAPVSPIVKRRPSIIQSRARSGTNSSPEDKESFIDLTNHGYTSVFVHLPYTPTTPSPYLRRHAHENMPVPPVPQTPKTAAPAGLKRFKSLGMLKRARTKSTVGAGPSIPLPPTPRSPKSPTGKRPTHGKSKSFSASKPKKSNANAPPLPPSLASELLLMQFADGGSLESHAQRMMKHQAKATAPAGSSSKVPGAEPLAMSAVYKDENGVMWWDEDEALEYKPLVPEQPPSPVAPWVPFGGNLGVATDIDAARKGSITSVLTTSSAGNANPSPVDLSNIITPANVEAYGGVAMQVLTQPASATAASFSSESTQNKRVRRRPAPLKLHSADEVHKLNVFEDSFVPAVVAEPETAPASGAAFDVDRDGDVVMVENDTQSQNDGRRNGVVFASPTNPAMMGLKKMKMGLKLFGGRA